MEIKQIRNATSRFICRQDVSDRSLAFGKRTDGMFFGYPESSVSCSGYSERRDTDANVRAA